MKKYDAIIIGAGHNGLTNASLPCPGWPGGYWWWKRMTTSAAPRCTREMHAGWLLFQLLLRLCSMMRQAIHSRPRTLTRHGLLLVPYLGTVNFGDDGGTQA